MNFAAVTTAKISVAELVERLDDDQAEIKEKQIVGGQKTLALRLERAHIGHREAQAEGGHQRPKRRAKGADQRANHRQGAHKKTVRVQQWEAHEHDVHKLETQLALAAFFVALEQLRAVGRQVILQQVCKI